MYFSCPISIETGLCRWRSATLYCTPLKCFMASRCMTFCQTDGRTDRHSDASIVTGTWDIRSSGVSRSVEWYFRTDISGQPVCPIFKIQGVFLHCLGSVRIHHSTLCNIPEGRTAHSRRSGSLKSYVIGTSLHPHVANVTNNCLASHFP